MLKRFFIESKEAKPKQACSFDVSLLLLFWGRRGGGVFNGGDGGGGVVCFVACLFFVVVLFLGGGEGWGRGGVGSFPLVSFGLALFCFVSLHSSLAFGFVLFVCFAANTLFQKPNKKDTGIESHQMKKQETRKILSRVTKEKYLQIAK